MLITILGFIIILGFLVLVHELGHFLVARASGIAVDEFGLGFPPKIFSVKRGNTVYSINAVPLGGFVKIKGEDGENNIETDSFGSKPLWKRAGVLVAGVTMNVLAGWLLLTILFMAGAPMERSDDVNAKYFHNQHLVVTEVLENSPAAAAGLEIGDTITALNNSQYASIEPFQEYIAQSSGEKVQLTFVRANDTQTIELTPQILETFVEDRAVIGIGLSEVGIVRLPPHKAVVAGTTATGNYIQLITYAFGGIIKNLWIGNGVGDSLGGPVAIAVATGDALELGFSHAIIFTAILSFNLAIINILPFPALDGGRLIFLAIEAVRRKPSKQEIEAWFHRIGFALLMLLVVIITYRDIARFGGRIWQAVVG